ncbi:hypothetical protein LZ32DRAFT_459989 [Colletotrichum eremochloae]|nr:hypothetical protein LZ32DRAFT_459989 [Colletotrichum eremochloae]
MDNEGGKEPSARLPTIYLLAHGCRASFSKLSQDLPATEYHDLAPKIADEAGRFNVWALNIGALQRPQSSSSLDSRLERSERMKNIVISGLQRLENGLKRANEIALGNMPNRTTSPATAEEIIKHSVGTVESTDKRDHDFTTEINELFNNIQSCITYLFTLSTLLRRSHPRGRTSQQGSQSSQSDPRPFITNAKDKFPKLKQSPWLAERIGQRTARQMDYIRYRQNHRAKLARVDVGLIQDELTERATTKATSFHDTIAASDSIKKPASGSSREESIYTVATSFAQTAVGDTYSGRIIPQLTDMWLDGRQLGYGEPVECPYCRTIQIIKDRYHWKHHVYGDLQTYICSFEGCSEGPFQTSHEWFQHEIDKHRRQWKCLFCHAKCNSASALEAHFKSQHPSAVSATQRKVMLKACEKPLNHFYADSCLLCDNWSPSSETESNSNKFRSHLAKHYQDLACEAIPLAIEGLEIKAAGDDYAPSDDNSAAPGDDTESKKDLESPGESHFIFLKIVRDTFEAKFQFPFRSGRSWGDMENVIKTKLSDLDGLSSRIENDCYDLLAPNGEIIRPSAWTETVMPGWTVTLSVWTDDMIQARDQAGVYEHPEGDILREQIVHHVARPEMKSASELASLRSELSSGDNKHLTNVAHDRYTEPSGSGKSTSPKLQEQLSFITKAASSIIEDSDADEAQPTRITDTEKDKTRIPARLVSKPALIDL